MVRFGAKKVEASPPFLFFNSESHTQKTPHFKIQSKLVVKKSSVDKYYKK